MRAQFVRGQDPKDAMAIGDVKGRKLKSISDLLVRDFEKIFDNQNLNTKPKLDIEFRQVNQGFGNRDIMETDQINISTEYKGYYFALGWLGNPFNTDVAQKFSAKWAKLPGPGPSDMKTSLTSNQALLELAQWIKSV